MDNWRRNDRVAFYLLSLPRPRAQIECYLGVLSLISILSGWPGGLREGLSPGVGITSIGFKRKWRFESVC